MLSRYRPLLLRIAAALVIGLGLRSILGLEPVWWLAWIAPAPLLVLAFASGPGAWRWPTALAALIGAGGNFPYFSQLMPPPAALLVILGQALLWVFVVGASRRLVLRYQSWWTIFAYPVLWVALDTLMAAFLPDGNWASLAYSQAEVLPVLQVTSLFGVAGVVFLLASMPSALAAWCVFGSRIHRAHLVYAAPLVLLGAAIGYGEARLRQAPAGAEVRFGLAAIDDAIGPNATPGYVERIWSGYERQVAALAAQDVSVVVLPEKIAVLSPSQAALVERRLGALAARHKLWLEAGLGIDDGRQRRNISWLFTPSGTLAAGYQKHFVAPPEREFAKGVGYSVTPVGGVSYGIAICKDMHFAVLGRAYGQRGVGAMLVPAWDFQADRWMAARMTITRGVENDFAVVRSSREGLLTVSDGRGRVIAERRSGPLPGAAMAVTLRVGAPQATLYGRLGDSFGWLCVAGAGMLLAIGRGANRNLPAPTDNLRRFPRVRPSAAPW
jgi:apolipoprotein N-acyltransferase